MSWHFNADYESWLFSGSPKYEIKSSRENREFEHLVHFFEERARLYHKKLLFSL